MSNWTVELNRENAPASLEKQIGFELQGIKEALTKFCHSHDRATKRCTIGFFIYFYDHEQGSFLRLIEDIQIKKLDIIFPDKSNQHWLERVTNSEGKLELSDAEADIDVGIKKVKAKALEIHHRMNPTGQGYATPVSSLSQPPYLDLRSGINYGVKMIAGYKDTLRIAYLDYGTLLHMFLAYKIGTANVIGEDELKFIFTGAEINHGEMVSPYFQEERYKDWGRGFTDLDPSVTATLKMEGVYKDPNNAGLYMSPQYHPYHLAANPNLTLPGVKVLAPCRRFWQTIEQVLNSSASQLELNNPVSFAARQSGINHLSEKLTKNLKEVLGKGLND